MTVRILQGDCREVLAGLDENSIDAIVTDPPYHLQTIVKRFSKSGRTESTRTKSGLHQRTAEGFMGQKWDGGDVAFQPATWEAVLRVLKPGGYVLAFSSCRTFGRMQVAFEDAGFITHPFIAWIFGQGFPKAHRVDSEEWDGWRYGTQSLKPAIEPIYFGQKPFSEKTGTANILKHGTGAVNIEGCKVHAEGETTPGRWPANLIHDGSDEVLAAFPDAPGQIADASSSSDGRKTQNVYGAMKRGNGREGEASAGRTYEEDGSTNFAMKPGARRGDTGSAARFFYCAKASKKDRAGSKHPTVKPIALMRYLCRLITPPGGTVLDPFAGSGTTGQAATEEGFNVTLIEREDEYVTDIKRRMGVECPSMADMLA